MHPEKLFAASKIAPFASVSSAPMVSQPLEIPRLRSEVTASDPARHAQVLLLVGYAPPTAATPRRDVSDVLVDG